MHVAVSMIAVFVCVALAAKTWVAIGREMKLMDLEHEAASLAKRAERQRLYATQAALGLTQEEWAQFDQWRDGLEVQA